MRHVISLREEDFGWPQERQQIKSSIEHVETAVGISRNLSLLYAFGATPAS